LGHAVSSLSKICGEWRIRSAVSWRDVCDSVCLNVQPTPHPPAGRSGLLALNVHNPSAGEGPAPSADGLVKTPVAGHPLHKGKGEELALGERGELCGSYPSAKLPGDNRIWLSGFLVSPTLVTRTAACPLTGHLFSQIPHPIQRSGSTRGCLIVNFSP
jgi:hypothetical protein